LHAAAIDSNGDHRIAMSFAVLGMAVDGLTISGYRSVSKTFPRFFEALDRL
jgi:3-phosphoshikimate 1-carboxyvinyltransferase